MSAACNEVKILFMHVCVLQEKVHQMKTRLTPLGPEEEDGGSVCGRFNYLLPAPRVQALTACSWVWDALRYHTFVRNCSPWFVVFVRFFKGMSICIVTAPRSRIFVSPDMRVEVAEERKRDELPGADLDDIRVGTVTNRMTRSCHYPYLVRCWWA